MKKERTETNTKQSKNERIEQFLKEHYIFRYNTVKSRTEFKPQGEQTPFAPLTKYDINSMRRLVDGTLGIYTSADNIRAILESDFCNKVNPITVWGQVRENLRLKSRKASCTEPTP